MVQLVFTLHGSSSVVSVDIAPGDRIAAALLDGVITTSKVIEAFPYEGDFHFRVKALGADVGVADVDFIWLDLIPEQEALIQRCSQRSDLIEVQALALALPKLSVEEEKGQMIQYLQEVKQVIPEERQRALPFVRSSGEAAASSSSGSRMANRFGSGLNNMKKALSSKLKRISRSDGEVEGNSSAAAALSSAAGGWWNAMRATAEKLSEHVVEAVGQIAEMKESKAATAASPEAQDSLQTMHSQLVRSFSDDEPAHITLLSKLWSVHFSASGYKDASSGQSSAPAFRRRCAQWKRAGWQQEDPAADLKNSGLLALYAMIYMGETYPQRTQQMINCNQLNTKSNYPFAIVAVNLTLLLAELFHLRNKRYNEVRSSFWEMFRDGCALYEVFALGFMHIDSLWKHRGAVRADFAKIIGEVKALLSAVLARGPCSLQEFKQLAMEEGVHVES